MATIFSRIISGEIPCYKVAEDDRYFAFLDINPLKRGHTLVIPKLEVDYIFDLDDEWYAGLMSFARNVALQLERSIECKRVAVVVLGLEVPHVHIHLIPIDGEGDVDFKREREKISTEEMQSIAANIASK
ncbi:MAG: HIT domain-containing protein [Rikenellaceae bacterium]